MMVLFLCIIILTAHVTYLETHSCTGVFLFPVLLKSIIIFYYYYFFKLSYPEPFFWNKYLKRTIKAFQPVSSVTQINKPPFYQLLHVFFFFFFNFLIPGKCLTLLKARFCFSCQSNAYKSNLIKFNVNCMGFVTTAAPRLQSLATRKPSLRGIRITLLLFTKTNELCFWFIRNPF